MSYTISNAKDDLSGMLHGTSLNKISNLYNVFNRAARDLMLDIDPNQTRRTQTITNALYDKVYNYAVPTDLKGDRVIQIRLAGDATDEEVEQFHKVHEKYFEVNRDDYEFDVQLNSGTKFVRIARQAGDSSLLNQADSLTLNGTWSVGGDASNLLLDEQNYVSGNASLKYDLDGVTGSAYIQTNDMTSVDLSEYEDVGSIFLWQYIPDASKVNSYTLYWGNDLTTNYWEDTITAPHFGTFVNGWNLLRFDWVGATENGSPDSSAIDSLKLILDYDTGTAIQNVRLDNIVCRYGRYYEMVYYSDYLFEDSTGTWKLEADDGDDVIHLGTENYNLFLFKLAEHATAQSQDTKDDPIYFENKYNLALNKYKRMYASEVEKTSQKYYKF